jgi:putative phosphoribosyl transferase
MTVFADRVDAGRQLADRLKEFRGQDVVALGLPRGGVPVASEVAIALDAPLDVIVVRKLGLPIQPEVAMGAIGEGGAKVTHRAFIGEAAVTESALGAVEARERGLLDALVARLRRGRERIDLAGRIALIVDDGIATGATAEVACAAARELGARRVIVAVPVAPAERGQSAQGIVGADEVVCVQAPERFQAVGQFYTDFRQTSDDEVIELLDRAADRMRERDS